MSDLNKIPILEIPKLTEFHFGNVESPFRRDQSPFYINRLEHAVTKLHFPLPPHRKTVYDLIFLIEGESTRFYLHFSPKIFDGKEHLLKSFPFLLLHTSPIVNIPADRIAPILNILERLVELFESDDEQQFNLHTWYLLALFEEVNRYSNSPQKVEKSRDSAAVLTQQYKEALTEHIFDYRTVQEFANLLHVTPNHLNKCIKKTLNRTAQTLLNDMLVLEAKSLLKYSDLTISQIADSLYRSSPSNFSRFFKNQTGMSPSDYIGQ